MQQTKAITERIKELGDGAVFSPKDFLDIGNRLLIDKTLSNLNKAGTIQRIGRGLYHSPKQSNLLDTPAAPDIDQVAKAIARKHRWTITPHGALAANLLGLSRQVPAKIVYMSDGPTREISAGGNTIRFQHTQPKNMRTGNYSTRIIIQALSYMGKNNIGTKEIEYLKNKLPAKEKQALLTDARYGTDWIFETAKMIAGGSPVE